MKKEERGKIKGKMKLKRQNKCKRGKNKGKVCMRCKYLCIAGGEKISVQRGGYGFQTDL